MQRFGLSGVGHTSGEVDSWVFLIENAHRELIFDAEEVKDNSEVSVNAGLDL
jgi:molybdopterin/thiamine biosynthesis adenylyltransferase